MKIYTKTGDDGQTGLFSGRRVLKSALQVEAYGDVDELNSWLGYIVACGAPEDIRTVLTRIQHDLHRMGADLATPLDVESKIKRMSEDRTLSLEGLIDQFESELTPLTQFILPGGSPLSSQFHIARCVCRRAERAVVRFSERSSYNTEVMRYLNRLSDLLFVLARVCNARSKIGDIIWSKEL